eukprot:TRINITY_DN80955_c0_g1_i1.p1 TRINITY_DN80955_c0_g1~~TRINITY_DN80955_c0_g1_i1.p1  ORF type:complete len:475 (-),score=83.16 TRINITY_DN80955_c0_g1_i1:14-1438(-)
MAVLPTLKKHFRRRYVSSGVVLIGVLAGLRTLSLGPGSSRLAWSRPHLTGSSSGRQFSRRCKRLARRSSLYGDEPDTEGSSDDEGAEADGPSPEAWREFRARLIQSEEKDAGGDDIPVAGGDRRSVAPRNEELLKKQNEKLWNEYVNGAWAHVGLVEPGALMCSMPLEAQLIHLMRTDDSDFWPKQLRKRLEEELPDAAEANRSKRELFASWAANTHYVYRLAQNLVADTLNAISEKAENGELDPALLTPAQRDIVQRYFRAQERWQHVCLVLQAASPSVAQQGVVLNRPLARSIDKKLANLLLNGLANGNGAKTYDDRTVLRCAQAFGDEAAVYLGGDEEQDQPALLVHGIADLPGAEEISPGTGIFTGGVEAAIDGVLSGIHAPLDFRWFVGRSRQMATGTGAWRAIACARPIALKQCLGLPKPLWHEVLELCGGESASLSQLELQLRTDLEPDEPAGDGASGPAPAKSESA